MIPTTANFDTARNATAQAPVFVLDLPTLGLRCASRAGQPGLVATNTYLQPPTGVSQQVQDLQGKSTIGTTSALVVDVNHALLALFPATAWYGKAANLYIGFDGLPWPTDYMQYLGGVISAVAPNSDHTGFTFTIADKKRTLRTQAYGTGDDGATPTSSKNPRTVDGNPLDLVTSLLETELGIASANIDTASIAALRNGRFACSRMLFSVTKVVDALTFLEQELLLPNGLFHFVRYDGRYAIGDLLAPPIPVPIAFAFGDSNTVGSPTLGQKTIYNAVEVQMDYDGSNYLHTEIFDDTASLTKFGLQQQLTIASKGLRTNLQGATRAGITARRIFLRYANGPCSQLALTAAGLVSANVEVGDYVQVSNSKLENLDTGAVGWANRVCQVMAVQPRWIDNQVDFTLLDVTNSLRQAYQFAPDTVPSWPTATVGERDQYIFQANASSEQSDGTPAAGVY